MYCTDTKTVKARKSHRCTSCGEVIAPGTLYTRWLSVDDSAMTNKMHTECYTAHEDDARANGGGQWEYTPHSYPRGSLDA